MSFSSFGGLMVRALDYEWDAQTRGVEVQASAMHFSFLEFFSKRLMSFIISRIIAILLQISFIIFDFRIGGNFFFAHNTY